jgi:hypothetical protein
MHEREVGNSGMLDFSSYLIESYPGCEVIVL